MPALARSFLYRTVDSATPVFSRRPRPPWLTRADADASRISASGTPIGQSQIAWMNTPHFYKRDRLIVLYVGQSEDVIKPLEAVLGPPFATGRR
jgi:hypothetical protein